MAMTDDEKKELRETMAEGIAEGLKLFRSNAEEEAAKREAAEQENKGDKKEGGTGDNGNSDGFSLAGFLLGRR